MIGTIVNTATVIIGSAAGLILRAAVRGKPSPVVPSAVTGEASDGPAASSAPFPVSGTVAPSFDIPPSPLPAIVLTGLGLATLALGLKMALEARQMLIVILSMVLGGLAGQVIGIEEALERLAEKLKRMTRSSEGTFVTGFVTASVLFCAGPMTILGSIQDGLQHDPKLLLIKSLMDGISSTILASTLGVGVIGSAVTVLVVQGVLTLLSAQLGFLTQARYLSDFTAVGGLIIIALGIRLTGIKDIKAGNLLPALVLVVLMVLAATKLGWIA